MVQGLSNAPVPKEMKDLDFLQKNNGKLTKQQNNVFFNNHIKIYPEGSTKMNF